MTIGDNGNIGERITREEILNQPFLEEGTFLSYASKVTYKFFFSIKHFELDPKIFPSSWAIGAYFIYISQILDKSSRCSSNIIELRS